MHNISTKAISYGSITVIVLLAVVGGASYYFGIQHQMQEIRQLKDEQAANESSYAKSISTVQTERNAALNDYQAACYEYQKLHAAYDLLYDKTGISSGQAQYSSPDDARGNEDSCYR